MPVLQKTSIRFFKRFPTAISSGKMQIRHLFRYGQLKIFSSDKKRLFGLISSVLVFEIQQISELVYTIVGQHHLSLEKLIYVFNNFLSLGAESPPKCFSSEFGCCWDYISAALGPGGKGCPPCDDNRRYPNVCHRFKTYCRRKGISGKWMRGNCPDACGHCGTYMYIKAAVYTIKVSVTTVGIFQFSMG